MTLAGCGGGDGEASSSPAQASDRPPTATPAPTPPASGGSQSAPTIQGVAASSVVAGQSYSFQPTASDPDGDPLTFSVSNLPAWASFNSNTGRLSGRPSAADVGTYENITISVSDGSVTVSLPPFNITVNPVAAPSGSATLTWLPPTQNTDGTPLTNLSGYEVRYGRDPDNLDQSVRLNNPSMSVYVLENLSPGTWYFAVAAVNDRGIASPLSNVASKTIG